MRPLWNLAYPQMYLQNESSYTLEIWHANAYEQFLHNWQRNIQESVVAWLRDPYKIWHTLIIYISKTCKASDLKFGTRRHTDNFSKTKKIKIYKWGVATSRDPYKLWHTLEPIYKTSNTINFKFGAYAYMAIFSNISACKKKEIFPARRAAVWLWDCPFTAE